MPKKALGLLTSKKAITKAQAIAVVVIIVVVAIIGGAAYYYSTLPSAPTPTPTPTPTATPTPTPTATPTPTPTPTATPTPTPTPTPTKKMTLVSTEVAAHWFIYEMGADPTFAGSAGPDFIYLCYETLFAYNPEDLKNGILNPVPWLAESYEVSEDGLVWTINLRKGIHFHNSGNEMTAADVKYTLDRYFIWPTNPGYPLDIVKAQDIPPQYFPGVVNRTEITGDYQVKIYLNKYYHVVPEMLAFGCLGIMDSKVVEAHAVTGAEGLSDHGYKWLMKGEPDGFTDVGTGPYQVKEFTIYQKYVLTKYTDYWGGPPELNIPEPKIDEIIILAVGEEVDARMRLMKGELNLATDLQPSTWAALSKVPGIKVEKASVGGGGTGLWFHCWSGPLKDWRVRKAIAISLDYKSYVEDVMMGTPTLCQGCVFFPGMPGVEKYKDYLPGKDFETAKALLDEAGYTVGPDGWRFQVELMVRPKPRSGVNFIDLGAAIKATLANIGIDVVITVYEVGEYYARILDRASMEEFMWLQPFGPLTHSDPAGSQLPVDPNNYYGWNSTSQGLDEEGRDIFEHFLELYNAAQNERNPTERIKKFQELNEYLINYGPEYTIFSPAPTLAAYTENVHGLFLGPQRQYPAIFWMTVS